ncbi:ComF family protein [Paenibacillus sp. BK033]|nr:ComF family protein [Paenibacillus sp. BK033]
MRHILKQLFRRSTSELRHSLHYLKPSSGECPFCGKGIKQASPGLSTPQADSRKTYLSYLPPAFTRSICSSCLAAIPWLIPIKCRVCGRGITCPDCIRRMDPMFIANRSAVQYSSEMREWLAQYKYRGNERLEPLLAQMMLPAFEAITKEAEKQSFSAQPPSIPIWDAVTFVPVSMERAEERGFNQAERFASILAKHHRLPLYNLLVRERHTGKQSFKTRLERMKDTQRLFHANPHTMALLRNNVLRSPMNAQVRSIRILLVDDIYTTGSTIGACAAALHQHSEAPLDIYSLTWARS